VNEEGLPILLTARQLRVAEVFDDLKLCRWMFGLVRMVAVAVTNVKGRHDTDDCGRPPRSPKSAAREIVVIRDELGPCQTRGRRKERWTAFTMLNIASTGLHMMPALQDIVLRLDGLECPTTPLSGWRGLGVRLEGAHGCRVGKSRSH
jgi:hypothetical protein